MIPPLSANSQAILLLTAPLIAGRNGAQAEMLTPGEYNRLAKVLKERQCQPADLLGAKAGSILEASGKVADRKRLEQLLGRGFLLSQAVDHWHARAIWVISRADAGYPRRLKSRLKEEAPPILYGCGDLELLECGGLAVVGSRHVDNALLEYTETIGRLAASAGKNLVSGGAKGIDQAAMRGTSQAGGTAVGVLADSLERAALAREHREGLLDGRLTLVSPYDPAAGFNVGHAMQRNKLIYALADAALVVSSDFNKGGTWTGAVEQLEKYHCGPLFVRVGDGAGRGNDALIRKGAQRWPDSNNVTDLLSALARGTESMVHEQRQDSLPLMVEEEAQPRSEVKEPSVRSHAEQPSAEILRPAGIPDDAAAQLLHSTIVLILKKELTRPATESQVAQRLNILKPQAKVWLAQLVREGRVERLAKPIRFRWTQPN